MLMVSHVVPYVSNSGNRKQEHERSADQIPILDTGDQNQTISNRNPGPRLDDADCGGLKDSNRDQRKHDKDAKYVPQRTPRRQLRGGKSSIQEGIYAGAIRVQAIMSIAFFYRLTICLLTGSRLRAWNSLHVSGDLSAAICCRNWLTES